MCFLTREENGGKGSQTATVESDSNCLSLVSKHISYDCFLIYDVEDVVHSG